MKILISLLISGFSLMLSYGQRSDLIFEISSNSETVLLGENIILTYRIYDPDLAHLANSGDIKPKDMDYQKIINPSAFSYSISLETIDTGLIKIGPFKINYQNQELISNEIFIRVLKQKEGNYLIFDVPATAGYDSEGFIRIRSNKIDISNIELRYSKYYTIIGRSYTTTTKFINKKSEKEYTRIFQVRYTKKGILELTKEDLLKVPGDFIIDSAKIEIK